MDRTIDCSRTQGGTAKGIIEAETAATATAASITITFHQAIVVFIETQLHEQ